MSSQAHLGRSGEPSRPLAVVMVADPTPLTLTNLKRLSEWCDLVLTEGTTTTSGTPREALRTRWRELLDLEPPRLRVVTTDLGGHTSWQRQATQRNSAIPVLMREDPARHVLILDADEFIDAGPVLELMRSRTPGDEPVRLGMVPLYGAIDRVARGIHCCWKAEWPDLREARSDSHYLFAGGAASFAGTVGTRSPSSIRFASRLAMRDHPFGWHITMAESSDRVAWKLGNMRHVWDERVLSPLHLDTMLSVGVHHAGWWVASPRDPEPWLLELASVAGLRVAGAPAPESHLRALRAWAEARLDSSLPDDVVTSLDVYAARRNRDADDLFSALAEWTEGRPTTNSGHVRDSTSGPDAHGDEEFSDS